MKTALDPRVVLVAVSHSVYTQYRVRYRLGTGTTARHLVHVSGALLVGATGYENSHFTAWHICVARAPDA